MREATRQIKDPPRCTHFGSSNMQHEILTPGGVLHQLYSQLGTDVGKERLEKPRRGDQEPENDSGLLRDLPMH